MKKLTIGSLKETSLKQADFKQLVNENTTEKVKKAQRKKRVVLIKQNKQSFRLAIEKNQTVLDAALGQKLPLNYSCKKGTCGKCKVHVVEGNQYLQPVNGQEEKKLEDLIHSGYRLACQAIGK